MEAGGTMATSSVLCLNKTSRKERSLYQQDKIRVVSLRQPPVLLYTALGGQITPETTPDTKISK